MFPKTLFLTIFDLPSSIVFVFDCRLSDVIFKMIIWGGLSLDIRSEITFYEHDFMALLTCHHKTKFSDLISDDIPPRNKFFKYSYTLSMSIGKGSDQNLSFCHGYNYVNTYSCINTFAHSCLRPLSNERKSMFKSGGSRAVWKWVLTCKILKMTPKLFSWCYTWKCCGPDWSFCYCFC